MPFRNFLSGLVFGICFLGATASSSAQNIAYAPGETFTYAIKKFGLRAGTATLVFKGPVKKNEIQYIQIVFTADGFNFYDQENIFADPKTLLPLRVERTLNIFGNREKIIELYDPGQGKAAIKKYDGDKVIEEKIFEKDRPIDNLYCFLYRYREQGVFAEGKAIQMFLPTKEVELEIVGKKRIGFYSGADEAWYMQSRPSAYRIWFGTQRQKLPLRIDGAVGIAKAAMILVKYQSGKIE